MSSLYSMFRLDRPCQVHECQIIRTLILWSSVNDKGYKTHE